jgi:hypothetical protein
MTRAASKAGPRTSWYHFQASGLMGSPTLPSRRSDLREEPVTYNKNRLFIQIEE